MKLARISACFAAFLTITTGVMAGEVTGKVSDAVSGKGIHGVRVSVRGADGKELKTFTDDDGQYTVENVPAGKAQLVYSHRQYSQFPTTQDRDVPGSGLVNDVQLFDNGKSTNVEYLTKAADHLAKLAGKDAAKAAAVWESVRKFDFPTSSKVVLANTLSSKAEVFKDVPAVQPYLVRPDDVVAMEAAIDDVAAGKVTPQTTSVIQKYQLMMKPDLIRDAAQYKVDTAVKSGRQPNDVILNLRQHLDQQMISNLEPRKEM